MDIDEKDSVEEIIAEPEDVISSSGFFSGLLFLQSNGWYILITCLLFYYIWKTKISSFVERLKKKRENEKESAKIKKDPDLYRAREEARMAAVIRLQNSYNEQAVKMRLMAEEKKKKKVEALISRNSHLFAGKRLNDGMDCTTLTGSRGEKNPARPQSSNSSPSGSR